MGTSLYFHYYPKECNSINILPFLSYDLYHESVDGKYVSPNFYKYLNTYAIRNEEFDCWIFYTKSSLLEFASKHDVPEMMSNYILYPEYYDFEHNFPHKEDDIFIIWAC